MKPGTVLVVGATGATGRRVVAELLGRGQSVRALVRSGARLSVALRAHPGLSMIEGELLEIDDARLREIVSGCDAVVSCLGHNPTFRGIVGPPWRLVTQAASRLCAAIQANEPERPVRFVLMGSAGVRNHDLGERVPLAQRLVLLLLRVLVPPHADNEQAAEHLRVAVGRDTTGVEWCVVRPDGLEEGDEVSAYDLHASPTRSAIFDAGRARRINVAHFMARLATEDAAWAEWRFRMPVLYNREKAEGRA
ncbi:MAG: NAD(P)H-binding protein [Gammaproteobacteria bacterium]|jgi:nucleoside-diphosphate-sugar epimerase|nr:NAD(P)H-binding protein [Gammaproteobacteria bacterium]